MRTKQTKASLSRGLAVMTLTAAASLAVVASMQAAAGESKLAFKLDPRLTNSLYMGDRWVTATTFTQVQQGAKLTVAAKGPQGTSWVAADSSMVTVTPVTDREVRITINRAGQTTMTAAGKVLTIKAEPAADPRLLKVQISQN